MDTTPPTAGKRRLVGEQLARRREALDLTQPALAARIGISAATVSVTERGHTEIQRGRRLAWEKALGLKAGTISSAYDQGTPLQVVVAAPTGDTEPYADLSDPHERAIWEMRHLSPADRRTVIDILRADRTAPPSVDSGARRQRRAN